MGCLEPRSSNGGVHFLSLPAASVGKEGTAVTILPLRTKVGRLILCLRAVFTY